MRCISDPVFISGSCNLIRLLWKLFAISIFYISCNLCANQQNGMQRQFFVTRYLRICIVFQARNPFLCSVHQAMNLFLCSYFVVLQDKFKENCYVLLRFQKGQCLYCYYFNVLHYNGNNCCKYFYNYWFCSRFNISYCY